MRKRLHLTKRILAGILVICMTAGSMDLSAFAMERQVDVEHNTEADYGETEAILEDELAIEDELVTEAENSCEAMVWAEAEEGEYNGLKYVIDESAGTICITGFTAELPSEVEIPDRINGLSVNSIGSGAFQSCKTIEKVKLPSTITGIGYHAFMSCSKLSEFDLSDVSEPFEMLPYNDYFKGQIFSGCSDLKSVEIPSTWDEIPDRMFWLSDIESIDLSGCTQITQIGYGAFYSNSKLMSINLPANLQTIGKQAFWNCQNLTKIELPSTMTGIGMQAFGLCKKLEEFDMSAVPEPLEMIEDNFSKGNLFNSCSALTTVSIPASWNKIPNIMFEESEIQTLDLSGCSLITQIDEAAFHNCRKLTTIELPSNLRTIKKEAFWNCTSLSRVELPASVAEIGYGAFSGCSLLEECDMSSIEEPIAMIGVSTVYGELFRGCSKLTSVNIPSSWDKIPDKMLNNSEIQSIDLSKCTKITSIESGVFSGCSKLATVEFPENLRTIEKHAFVNCAKLSKIGLPSTVTGIGYEAFYGCRALKEVDFSAVAEPFTMIEESGVKGQIFRNCDSLTTVKIPASWSSIPDKMFANGAMESVDLSDCSLITRIDSDSFYACDKLTTIKLPDGLQTIERRAFIACPKLSAIELPASVTEVKEEGFFDCTSLEKIYINNDLINIATNAFKNISAEANFIIKRKSPLCVRLLDDGCNVDYKGEYEYADSIAKTGGNSFTVNKSRLDKGVPCAFTLDYACDEGRFEAMSDVKMNIHIPRSLDLVKTDISLDGRTLLEGEFDYNTTTRRLTIPVSKSAGVIRLSLVVKEIEKIQSYAQLEFVENGVAKSEVVECLGTELTTLSLNCSNRTSSRNLYVWGQTNGEASVNIYCDSVLVSTIKANKSGEYSTQLTLEAEGNHVIMAESGLDSSVYATKNVIYTKVCINITQFSFFYQRHLGVWTEKDLLGDPGKVLLTINPQYELLFKVRFSNSDDIKDVYIVSTKGSDKKYLKAESTSDGTYVASGYFDPDNIQYVPGQLSISYTLTEGKSEEIVKDIEISSEEKEAVVREKIYEASDGKLDFSNLKVENQTSVTNGDVTKIESDVTVDDDTKVHVTTTQTRIPSDKTDDVIDDPSKYLNTDDYQTSTLNGYPSYYAVDYDNDVIKTLAFVDGAYQLTFTQFGLFGAVANDSFLVNISNIMSASRSFAILADTNATDEQRAAEIANLVVIAGSYIVGIAATAALGPVGAYIVSLTYTIVASGLQECISNIILLFIMDPSGYVYEVIPENRLQGVKVSVYYKENLSDAEGILWNASDYGQLNPLYTDEFGEYAWDVPEGYWQVKFEKDGYATAYSEWLPVPPVQTEINVALVSTEPPVVENAYADNKEVTVMFNQYINLSTLGATKITDDADKNYAYTIKENSAYSKTATLVLSKSAPESVQSLHLSMPATVANYAGTQLSEGIERDVIIAKAPVLAAVDNVVVGFGMTKQVKVQIGNFMKDHKLDVTNSSPIGLEAVIGEIDKNGNANLKIKGNLPGDYTLSLTVRDTAVSKDIAVHVGDDFVEPAQENPEGLWIDGIDDKGYAYTGKAIKPAVKVYDHDTLLTVNKDYTITYARNTNANDASIVTKAPTITVIGKGNYAGKETATFKINQVSIEGNGFYADEFVLPYKESKSQTPAIALTYNGKALKKSVDYDWAIYKDADIGREEPLTKVKEEGQYHIIFTGKGNYTGIKEAPLTVSKTLKSINYVTVSKIASQPYTGEVIKPKLTVKFGNTKLIEGEHYRVTCSDTSVGTAYAVIIGIPENGYSGTKKVSFQISGTSIKSAKVTGVPAKVEYTGSEIVLKKHDADRNNTAISVCFKATTKSPQIDLAEGKDYKVEYQKNIKAGTATVIITGIGGYTGTVKKTFKITPYKLEDSTDSKVKVVISNNSVEYAKGGAKPEVIVTFAGKKGPVVLTAGTDYTLVYANNKAVNDCSGTKKPTVTIKGKGSFSGSLSKNYKIVTKDLSKIELSASDVTYSAPKNRGNYATTVKLTDTDKKALEAGRDYEKTLIYSYDETGRNPVGAKDIVEQGTVLYVTVKAKGANFTGKATTSYRVTKRSIAKATFAVKKQYYTGSDITISESDFTTAKFGKTETLSMYNSSTGTGDYRIIGYSNNTHKGKATVIVQGMGSYGGTKKITFNIGTKGFNWWWKK